MLTPYDWQEGMGNRSAFVEGRLSQGSPVLAISIEAGILLFTYKRQSGKLFEIYDRLGFGALGQQSDIEAIRVAAVEFAHQEGYSRSESDVTIQRVVTGVSTPLKQAFGDFTRSPILAASVFAELGATSEEDRFYTIDYDGDYHQLRNCAVVSVGSSSKPDLRESIPVDATVEVALEKLAEIWQTVASEAGERDVPMEGLHREVLFLQRKSPRENLFTYL